MWGEDDAYEPVGFTNQPSRPRVEDLIEIQIFNGRGDEDVVTKKLYNEENVPKIEEWPEVENNKESKTDIRSSTEVEQFLMYKTYIDKYK